MSLKARRNIAAGLTGCLVAAFVLAGSSSALALDVGPYHIDGTVPDATTPPLTTIPDPSGNTKELGPINSSSTKIGVIQNAAVPMLGLTNPNGQVDLNAAWLDTARVNGIDYLYFAWQRDANSGSGFIAYEFMKKAAPVACAYDSATQADLIANCNPWANRAAGDFMILWDQSGGSKVLAKRVWSGTAPNLVLGPPISLAGGTYAAEYSADGFRGEAAIDLTDNGLGSNGACLAFANVIPSTVTGNSDSADYKDTILKRITLSNCTSTTVTTPKDGSGAGIPAGGLSIGTGVVGVKDSAVVSLVGGSSTPAGSVAFTLCKADGSGTCVGTPTNVGSTNLTGASYPATVVSPAAYVTSAGQYCWKAVFSGDPANSIPGSSDATSSECFTVNPVTPTLSTTAGPDVTLGHTVSDAAGLSGTATQPASPVINLTGTAGAAAGGTITFKLYGPSSSGCGTLVYTSGPVSVSGDGTYNTPNPQFQPAVPGDYHWVATYSGNSPNTNSQTHNTACDDTNEDVSVTTVPSTMSTAQSWVPNDAITISAPAGTGNLAGTVSFALYDNATCTGTAIYSGTAPIAGASPQVANSGNTTTVPAGSYWWQVSYDSTNLAQRDIAPSCQETSSLTIDNGSPVSSGP